MKKEIIEIKIKPKSRAPYRPTKVHKDKRKYSRKVKYKKNWRYSDE